jgi:hypothetical protein
LRPVDASNALVRVRPIGGWLSEDRKDEGFWAGR